MTKDVLLRIAIIATICGISTACKTSDPQAKPTDTAIAVGPDPVGADTSSPFPPDEAPADAELSFTRHRVEKGDTFYAIARKYGASVKDVMAANPGVEATALRIGQEILVPTAK